MAFSVEARLEASDQLSRQVAVASLASANALKGLIEEVDESRRKADQKEQRRERRRRKARGQTARALRSGAKAGLIATAGLAVGAAFAADRFGTTELAIAKIGNLIGEDRDAVEEFGGAIQNMAVSFGVDSVDTANAFYQAISAGVPDAQADLLGFMDVAGKASVAGAFSLETSVDGLTNAMNAYGESGTEAATAVADKFAVAEKLGKTTFSEIAEGIDKVGPLAAEMGISLDQVLGSLVSLSKPGVQTAQVFTQISGVMSGILKIAAGGAARKGLFRRTFGVKAGKDALKQIGGLKGLIEKLQKESAKPGKGNLIAKLFGRTEAQKALFRLTGKGFAEFTEGTKAIGNSAGQNDRNFANIQKRTGFRIKQMKSGFSVLISELGGGIADGLGLGEIEDIPSAVAGASGIIRGSAAEFAAGFSEAFSPLEKGAAFDWPGFAQRAGTALGAIASALGTVADGFATVIQKWTETWDLALKIKEDLIGEDQIDKAIKAAGGTGQLRTGQEKASGLLGLAESITDIVRGPKVTAGEELRAQGVAITELTPAQVLARQGRRAQAQGVAAGEGGAIGLAAPGRRSGVGRQEGLDDLRKAFQEARAFETKRAEAAGEKDTTIKVKLEVEAAEGTTVKSKGIVSDNAKIPAAVNTGTQKTNT